jgi:collagenase-like PrtC family protease
MPAGNGSDAMDAVLTIGPVLFHWPAEKKRDFYFRIADEAPVDTVYLGELVCSKRAPFFEPYCDEVAERLTRAGKRVVFSALAEVMLPREREMVAALCRLQAYEVEANDPAALFHLRGRPHRVGQYCNVYNEETLAYLAGKGARYFALNPELPTRALAVLGEKAAALGVTLEVQVYGRAGLALSARCYHARAHGRVKDNCQFVCEEDPDGMTLSTLSGQSFLSVNGIQTLSHASLNLVGELADLRAMGIAAFRLSPHDCDMVDVARIFRAALDGECDGTEASVKLAKSGFTEDFCNGFYYGKPGYVWEHTV